MHQAWHCPPHLPHDHHHLHIRPHLSYQSNLLLDHSPPQSIVQHRIDRFRPLFADFFSLDRLRFPSIPYSRYPEFCRQTSPVRRKLPVVIKVIWLNYTSLLDFSPFGRLHCITPSFSQYTTDEDFSDHSAFRHCDLPWTWNTQIPVFGLPFQKHSQRHHILQIPVLCSVTNQSHWNVSLWHSASSGYLQTTTLRPSVSYTRSNGGITNDIF